MTANQQQTSTTTSSEQFSAVNSKSNAVGTIDTPTNEENNASLAAAPGKSNKRKQPLELTNTSESKIRRQQVQMIKMEGGDECEQIVSVGDKPALSKEAPDHGASSDNRSLTKSERSDGEQDALCKREVSTTSDESRIDLRTKSQQDQGHQQSRQLPNQQVQQQQQDDKQLTNLIVNYLPQSMSQEEIRTLFSSIGEVESCKLIRDKSTINQSLGYGFVNYMRPEDAQRAIKSFNGLRLQNKTIKVSYARPSSESIKGANLYVSGLPKSMTQLELEQLFKPYGKIITSRILCDNLTGISKGVGFVRFDQRFEAEKAIENLNNTYIQIYNNSVNVSRQMPPPIPASDSTTGDDLGAECHSSVSTPIIVKFANSPSSNPQKQIAAAAAAAAAAATAPTSAHHHLMAASLHHSLGGPNTAGLGAYLGQVSTPSLHQISSTTRPNSGMRFSSSSNDASSSGNSSSQQQGPLYHYPSNRYRYTTPTPGAHQLGAAAELAALAANSAAAGAYLNPFAGMGAAAAATNLTLTSMFGPSALLNSKSPAGLMMAGAPASGATAAPALPVPGASAATQLFAGLSGPSLQACSGGQPTMAGALEQHAHRLLATSGQATSWCLFVYNLAPEIEENVIWKLFGPFGAVQQVNLVKDPGSNKCKGFAFVTMSDYNQALMAIQSLNGHTLANRVLQVSFKTNKVRKTMQSTSATS